MTMLNLTNVTNIMAARRGAIPSVIIWLITRKETPALYN